VSYEGQIAETITIVGHGAGHGFFATDRPNYRQARAVDGWQKVWGFFETYLVAR
jgi:dienelactone hydrolase